MSTATDEPKTRKRKAKSPYRKENEPKLTEVPLDFNSGAHSPLKLEDFADEGVFLDYRAHRAQLVVDKLLREAEIYRKYGSAEQRKSMQKFETMARNLKAVQAQMEEQLGADAVKELLDQISGN